MGAALGYGLGAPGRRVVQIVGDGAFQMTAQVPACLPACLLLLLLLLLWLHAFCDAALGRAGRACLYCCWLAAHGRVPFVCFRFIVLKKVLSLPCPAGAVHHHALPGQPSHCAHQQWVCEGDRPTD